MRDIEAPSRRPDFHSDSCYTILGCGKSGSPEELRRAYRDLSRKYHPDRYHADKETNHTFQRVYVAYSLIINNSKSSSSSQPNTPQEDDDDDVKFDREAMRQVRLEDAKREFVNEFGEFKEKYYSRGAIVALPYPYQLKERLENGKCLREAFTLRLGCLQFSFFRSFLIKKELGFFFLLSEMICVWGSLVLAIWNFLLEDFPEVIDDIPYVRDTGVEKIPHISIIGGIAVLIGSFVQHFWYGFTRHPIITDSEFGNWLLLRDYDLETTSTTSGGELGEIYRTCSQCYHSDDYNRSYSHVLTLLLCFPILLVDHIPAILLSIPVYLWLLCQNNCRITKNHQQQHQLSSSSRTHLAYQFAKSIGGLFVVVGSYLAWVLGGNYAKLAVAGVLYANQHLYTAILFRRSFFGFLQSVVFQGFFAVTIVRSSSSSSSRPRKQHPQRRRTPPLREKPSTDATDVEQGMPREEQKSVPQQQQAPSPPPPPAPVVTRNPVLSPSQKTIEESVIDIIPLESPQKTPVSSSRLIDNKPDQNDFGANFDGFYTRPRSYPELPSPQGSRYDGTSENGGENVIFDHRGKPHVKPVPGWYKKGEVITDTQQAAKEARLEAQKNNVNLFQCGADTTIEDDERYINPAGSLNEDKETATALASTKASTAFTKGSTTFTSNASKMEEKQGEEAEGPDLITLARSAKRRIEAEFYARIYGDPSAGPGGLSSPVSPDRRGASARRGGVPSSFRGGEEEEEQKQHRFEVPRTIEMRSPPKPPPKQHITPGSPRSPASYESMIDNTSDNASGEGGNKSVPSDESSTRMENLGFIPMYGPKEPMRRPRGGGGGNNIFTNTINGRPRPPLQQKTTTVGGGGNIIKVNNNRPQSPDGEIDNLLGPFVPLVKSATTRSNNYSVGASQVTRMQSNKEGETTRAEDDVDEEEDPVSLVLQHHPDRGLSGFRSVNNEDARKKKSPGIKPRRSRTTGGIPDLVVGYDKASADESEITLDRRQFRKKRNDDAPTFWEYWTSPTNSTLTRSVT